MGLVEMKIVHISTPWIQTPPLDYGGTELVAALLAEGTQKLGHRVHLFCRDSTLKVHVHSRKVAIQSLPEKYSEQLFLMSCAKAIPKLEPDIVHTHLESFAVHHKLLGWRRPLVLTLHIPVTQAIRDFLRAFPKLTCVVPSRAMYDLLKNAVPGTRVINHGIDVGAYHYQEEKKPYLLYLGRMCPSKGADKAIRFARNVRRPLVLAGPVYESDRKFFKRSISPHINNFDIKYLGPVGFGEKSRLLSEATALLNLIDSPEAFGLHLVEALASGTPIASLNRGAVTEIVADGVTGIVEESLSNLTDRWPELLKLSPAGCRQRAESLFDADLMISRYLELYDEQLNIDL